MPVNSYHVLLNNVTSDKMNWDYASVWDFGRDDSDAQHFIPWQTMEIINVFPTRTNGLKNTHIIHLFSNEDLKGWDTKAIGIAIAQRTEKILNSSIIIKGQ